MVQADPAVELGEEVRTDSALLLAFQVADPEAAEGLRAMVEVRRRPEAVAVALVELAAPAAVPVPQSLVRAARATAICRCTFRVAVVAVEPALSAASD